MHQFGILYSIWRRLVVRFLKIPNILDFMVIYTYKKWGKNYEISNIRDSHVLDRIILYVFCVLWTALLKNCAFTGLPNIWHFSAKITTDDATKIVITDKNPIECVYFCTQDEKLMLEKAR